jgi:hypothetical protein
MEVSMKFRRTTACWAGLWVVASVATPQVPIVSIKPQSSLTTGSIGSGPAPRLSSTQEERRVATAGAAILGYMPGPGPAQVRAIFGTAHTPRLGEQMVVPDGAKRLYLPPRQQYALLEQSSDEPVAIWLLHRSIANQRAVDVLAVKGAMAHPDLVAFSPRGDAAVLYSQADARLQVVSGLPGQPSLSRQLSTAALGTPSQIAITDDAALVVADLADRGMAFSLNGAAWLPLATGYTPQAWTFIPNSHSLAISDAAQRTILLLPDAAEGSSAFHVLAQNASADRLAAAKDGSQLAAANPSAGQIWTIDLKTGIVTPIEGFAKVDTLSLARDGFTVLLSASPRVSLLKLTGSGDFPGSAAHPETIRLAQDANGDR